MKSGPSHLDTELVSDMAIFAAVVEANGFSSAAEALQMSKSNVSRRVALLEARLDMTLLHRTTRKITLTECGRVYYEHCARMVAEARDADQAIRAMHSSPSGVLNVSVPETLGRKFILPLLPDFLALYPDIRLNLTITNRKADLREERCDLAVRKGEVEDDTLCAVSLGSSTQLLFASQSYLSTAPALTRPDQLEEHPFLSSRITYGPNELKLRSGADLVLKRVTPRVSVKDHEALLQLTLDGLGVALLPAWMTHDHVRRGTLVRVLTDWRGPSVDFNLVYLPDRSMAPNLRAFVNFLTARFRLNRPWEWDANVESLVAVGSDTSKRA